MCSYYLPWEFTSADALVACDDISSTAAKLQTECSDAHILIIGDFNNASLDKTWNHFHQHVEHPNRDNKTLDPLYANPYPCEKATSLHQYSEEVDAGGCWCTSGLNSDYRPGEEAAGNTKPAKGCRPDGIARRILKTCANKPFPYWNICTTSH